MLSKILPIVPVKSNWQHQVSQSALPASTKGFLALLSIEYMDAHGGSCFPSEQQLMEKFGYSRPTITGHIRRAVQGGYLEVWHFGHGLRNRRYNYRARLPDLPEDRKEFFVSLPEDRKEFFGSLGTMSNVNHAQESAAPELAAAVVNVETLSSQPLRTEPRTTVSGRTQLTEDWLLPDNFRQIAQDMTPDLLPTLETIADNFRDYHLSKATKSAAWSGEWRIWLRRERAPKQAKPAFVIQSEPSPASKWTPGKPAFQGPEQTPEQVQAEFEANMKRLGATFDPATNVWIPKNAAPPKPPATVTTESHKTPVTPAPRVNNQFRRDAMIVIQAINDGCTPEEVRELEAELKRRREAESSG